MKTRSFETAMAFQHDSALFAYARRLRLEADFELLKCRLLSRALDETPAVELHIHLFRAAAQAASLALQTPFPLLVFPGLFDENLLALRERADRHAAAFVTQS